MENDLTFGSWLDKWFKIYKLPHLKKISSDVIEYTIRLHVPTELKSKSLRSVTVLDLDEALALLPPSRTQKVLFDTFRSSMRKAYALDLVSKDISSLIEPSKYKMRVGSALTSRELDNFIKIIEGHKLEWLYKFYILSGCRRHEALTLKWSDIDFERMLIYIHGTKNEHSDRFIPFTNHLFELLSNVPILDKRIFPYNDDYVTKQFKKLCPYHKLHDLRHTFITLCAELNLHPSVTQRLVGHSKIDTTMRIYTHVQDEFIKKEAKKLDFSFINGGDE